MSELEPGQVVQVPWGLDLLKGVVLRTYDTGRGLKVVVNVEVPDLHGSNIEEVSVTLPADSVQPWEEGSGPRPGDWAHAYAYERNLTAEIIRVISQLAPDARAHISESQVDRGYDFELYLEYEGNEVHLRGVAKHATRAIPPKSLEKALGLAQDSFSPVALFSNVDLSSAAKRLLQLEGNPNFHWIKWSGKLDSGRLASELAEIFEIPQRG
ncbi:hypothetical protein ACIPYQ_31315 [Streptomyces sp. NPDC090045]|uniref:hypothetical protein n=1 Tax=Streptomyces sp. NPDC090045 TaxID=3365927 RepID=UPI003825DA3A